MDRVLSPIQALIFEQSVRKCILVRVTNMKEFLAQKESDSDPLEGDAKGN
jgi:hypothetical protein